MTGFGVRLILNYLNEISIWIIKSTI
jgi:hypothetical protein